MKSIITACEKLYSKGLVANHDGNITAKSPNGGFIATPTSFSKGDITENDLLVLNEKGQVVEGRHKVFSEIALHLAIYRVRPDIRCIVHAHPPTASAFGLAHQEIGTPSIPEAIVSLGRGIFNTQFISPLDLKNSEQEFSRVLKESDAFIIPGNGAWTVGQDVMQTYYRMELVEHVAIQHSQALQLGKVAILPEDLILALLAKRPKPTPEKNQAQERIRSLVEEEVRSIFSREE